MFHNKDNKGKEIKMDAQYYVNKDGGKIHSDEGCCGGDACFPVKGNEVEDLKKVEHFKNMQSCDKCTNS